jgi:hypothetical protein
MSEPLKFINTDTSDENRPPLWRRGDATILASAPGPTGSPDWRPELPAVAAGTQPDTSSTSSFSDGTRSNRQTFRSWSGTPLSDCLRASKNQVKVIPSPLR